MQPKPTIGLLRSMRRGDLVGVVINGVIGAGIFGLPSKTFALAGVYSIFAYMLCAVCVGTIVLCFAEVGSRYGATGGPLLYAREAFGPTSGFLVGWLVYVARLTSFAANCSLLMAYLALFYPILGSGIGRFGVLTAVVLTLAAMNVAGVRIAANASNTLAVGKLIPLAVFVIAGLFFLDPARFAMTAAPAYRPFAQSVLLLVYAFTGFEMSVIPAGEARKPGRDLPSALLIGMTLVVVFYILIQVVSIGTLPGLANSQRPLSDAAAQFLGAGGAVMITVGIVVSLAGNLSVLMLSASRIVFAAAERGQLPQVFAAIHPRFRTPVGAVLATAAIMLTLTLSGTFMWLLTLSTVSRLVTYLATAGALPVLRRRADAPPAAFRLPGGTFFSAAAIVLGVWLLSNCTLREARDTAIAAAAGLAVHLSYRAAKSRSAGRTG